MNGLTAFSGLVLVIGLFLSEGKANAATSSMIPVFACTTDRQYDALVPPKGPMPVNLPSDEAASLAVYSDGLVSIVAPRGWVCSSSATTTLVTYSIHPKEADLSVKYQEGLMFLSGGDNASSTMLILKYANRFFPGLISRDFLSENLQPGVSIQDIHTPKYSDFLHYDSPVSISYITPAYQNGIGLEILNCSFCCTLSPSALQYRSIKINGFLRLFLGPPVEACDMFLFASRLPVQFSKLNWPISNLTEQLVESLGKQDCSG